MRFTGNRILKRKTERQITAARELLDAVVYDVNTTEKYCRVKIQGSDSYIHAYYPENWTQTPEYLKPGNAVLITRPGGARGGRVEVSGHGLLLPTTTNNEGVVITVTPTDSVLSGCTLYPAN